MRGANVTFARELRVTMIDREGTPSRLVCPALPSPLHLLGGLFEWDALTWRDRLSALRMAGPLRRARRALKPGSTRLARAGETVRAWLNETDRARGYARCCGSRWRSPR